MYLQWSSFEVIAIGPTIRYPYSLQYFNEKVLLLYYDLIKTCYMIVGISVFIMCPLI